MFESLRELGEALEIRRFEVDEADWLACRSELQRPDVQVG